MPDNSLLREISSSALIQWDVKQFFSMVFESEYALEKLGNHLVHQTEKVQLSDFPDEDFGILGVSNKVGMFDASVEKGKDIRQKYHIVNNDWLAYNPYRINVGSIGLKTSSQKGGYISPAYVVFSCKDTVVPEYILMLMKSDFFNKLINDSTTGSVRQTLRFDKLAELKAPIPPVDEQKKILEKYHLLLEEAKRNEEQGDDYWAGLLNDIQSEVSTYQRRSKKNDEDIPLLHEVSFSSLRRWEVGYTLKEGRLEEIRNSFTCPFLSIAEIPYESLFGLSIKASETQEAGMIPMLRMSNITNGEIDYSELKYLPLECAVNENEDKWLLKDGDFLVVRTNGSKDLVGKAAVFKGDEVYTYASYLIRYRFDTTVVLPEYVNIVFRTSIVRDQIAVMRRQGGGQYNINSDEIGAILLPVPSISKQEELINRYNNAKNGANAFYKKAEELKEQARKDFEQSLLK